jgi:uncharacterized iron-regulated protein
MTIRLATLALLACTALPAQAAAPDQVAQTYVAIAAASYGDAVTSAQSLQTASNR